MPQTGDIAHYVSRLQFIRDIPRAKYLDSCKSEITVKKATPKPLREVIRKTTKAKRYEQNKRSKEKNIERYRTMQKRWREANKEKVKAYAKQWQKDNVEKTREYSKKSYRKRNLKNESSKS